MQSRKRYLDVLRIVAIFLVIYNHLAGYSLYYYSTGVKQFVYMSGTMLTRMNVPLFFMISGTLLLGKAESWSVVIKKRASRFLAVLCLFGAGLYLEYFILARMNGSERTMQLDEFLHGILLGNLDGMGSYWFIYAYLAFLFMLPFLQRIAKAMNTQDFKALIAIHFVFSSLLPMANILLGIVGLDSVAINGNFTAPLATTKAFFYPLIGYYIDQKIDLSKVKMRSMVQLAVAAVVGIVLSCLCTYYEGAQKGDYSQNYVQLFDYLTAMAAFLWVKYIFTQKTTLLDRPKAAWITTLSSLTFGMYLLDPYWKKWFYDSYNEAAEVYLPTIIVSIGWCVISMMLGGCVTALLKKIPGIKKIL